MRTGLLVLLAGLACADSTPMGPGASSDRLGVWVPGPTATLFLAEDSGLDNPLLSVVSDRPTWQALWAEVWRDSLHPPPLPPVDFVLASVVVVGMGRRAGEGYSVIIDSIVTKVSGAVLYASSVVPDSRCQRGAGESTPLHMVHTPGHPPIDDWRIGVLLQSCPP